MKNKAVLQAKKVCKKLLLSFGIKDSFTVKVKQPKENWVAMYRGNSQFTNGRGPIFWIAESLLDNSDELILSILHEYGHVIAEWAWMRSPELRKTLSNNWKGSFHNRDWDEEEWAEDFAQYLYYQSGWVNGAAIKEAVTIFANSIAEN